MIGETAVSGAYLGAVAYAFFSWSLSQGWGEFEARNLALFLMVALENAHVFNCRSETRSAFGIPLSGNWPLLIAVVGAQAVQIGAAFVPGLRDVLQIEPISLAIWLLMVPLAASAILVMEVYKAIFVRAPERMRLLHPPPIEQLGGG
jgi:magnesium-transporting ATPase (P-type)